MIIAFHVSLWRINIFHMRAYLSALSITHRSARQALQWQRESFALVLWLMCVSAPTCHISNTRENHTRSTFFALSLHSLNRTAFDSWHLHFHLSILGRFDNLIPLAASHSLYLRFFLFTTLGSMNELLSGGFREMFFFLQGSSEKKAIGEKRFIFIKRN